MIAAIVVIMIGRKRSRQASWIACSGVVMLRCAAARCAKSIIMIAFFLTMPISITMPMMAMMLRSMLEQHQRQQRAERPPRAGRKES